MVTSASRCDKHRKTILFVGLIIGFSPGQDRGFRFVYFSANSDRPPPFPVKTLYMVANAADRATIYICKRIVRRSFFVSCMPVHTSFLWCISRKRKFSQPNNRSSKRIILHDPRPAIGHNFCIGRSPAMAWRQFGAKIEKIALREFWKIYRSVRGSGVSVDRFYVALSAQKRSWAMAPFF